MGCPSVRNEGPVKTFTKEVPIQPAPSSSDLDNRSAMDHHSLLFFSVLSY